MSYRKGTVVKFKAGKGTSIGKIVKVADGMAEIRTKTGATVKRNVTGLSEPGASKEEDEESSHPEETQDDDEDGETQLGLFTGDEEE
jgi:hypothetical protein